jgi:nitroreductase
MGTGRAKGQPGFLEVVTARRSVRAFSRTPVEPATLEQVLEVVKQAPSAGDLQAYQIVVVEQAAARAALARAAHGQDFVAGAPLVLVFCADPERSAARYAGRGELFAIQDATIAAAYAQLAAVAVGLAGVWVGAFDESAVAAVVGGLKPVCVMPLGYAAERPAATPRRSLDDLVHRERLRGAGR